MELEIIKGLAQYGVLGLWTASLLFMNWQQRKDKKEEEKAAKEAQQYYHEMIATKLANQEKMLVQALEKIDRGLGDMRAKYAEDRMLRMQGKNKE